MHTPRLDALRNAIDGMTLEKVPAWNRMRSLWAKATQQPIPADIYSSPKKLNLGCSSSRLPTYVNCDVQPKFAPDIVCNVSELSFAADGEYDLIRASHVLEHFELDECRTVLQEWKRALRSGGYLVICVPNFPAIAWRTVLWPRGLNLDERSRRNGWINGLFALDLPPEFRHKVVFSENSLRELLEDAGFDVKSRLNYLIEEPYTLGIRDDSCNAFSLNIAAIKP